MTSYFILLGSSSPSFFGLSILFARGEQSEGEGVFAFRKEIDALLSQIVR